MKIEKWNVEDQEFWDQTGKKIANRNLWLSIPNLLLGFAIWMMWSIIILRIQELHEANPLLFPFPGADGLPLSGDAYRGLLYTLPAIAGLAGATLRIPNSFLIALSGGRFTIALTTLLMLVPTLGAGIALQNPSVSFSTLALFAVFSGLGGGAFASSMSNISFFFPKRVQGTSLGLNAGFGNLGVSICQVLLPFVMGFAVFGSFSGEGHKLVKEGAEKLIWVQNAGLVWVPLLLLCGIAALLWMNNLPQHDIGSAGSALMKFFWLEAIGFFGAALGTCLILQKFDLPELLKIFIILTVTILVTLALLRFATPGAMKEKLLAQFAIFGDKHNWVMTCLYVMTFGSFIGFSAAFPKLISDIFGYIRVDEHGILLPTALKNPHAINAAAYAWLAPLVGSLIRPFGGWLSDKVGGAKVTQWDTVVMIVSTLGGAYLINLARLSPTPEVFFYPFLAVFMLLFITTGIGNGSTFRMIPIIFSPEKAGPVLGWTSAIAAYGAFLIPNFFGAQIKAGTPEYAMYGFAIFYVCCLVINWYFYARTNAEIKC